MRREEFLTWFEEILAGFSHIPRHMVKNYSEPTYRYDDNGASTWVTEASAALASAFPAGHPCRQSWERLQPRVRPSMIHGGTLEELLGAFRAATKLIRDGRLGTLIDSIRVESESELLEQAEILADANYLAASMVIAGGALESHLRHLVDKHGLTIARHGSITEYNLAIAQARKAGNEIYNKADHDQIESWGKIRNEAAHMPGEFNRSVDQVKLMIAGVRMFIARTI